MTHPGQGCRSKAVVFHLLSAKFYVCQIDDLCFDSSTKDCSTVTKEEWRSFVHWCAQHNQQASTLLSSLLQKAQHSRQLDHQVKGGPEESVKLQVRAFFYLHLHLKSQSCVLNRVHRIQSHKKAMTVSACKAEHKKMQQQIEFLTKQ